MKLNSLLILILTFTLLSCGAKKDSRSVYTGKEQQFQKFINPKSLNKAVEPNLSLDKTIINRDYPFEIALYEDNTFFYDLPNLRTGTGTWKYNKGKLELRADLPLFDMYVEVYGADAEIKEAAIQFTDRFGGNTLKMENRNL